ncbi:MAG: ectoine hydroxylase [Acidimicrobiales bacterium]
MTTTTVADRYPSRTGPKAAILDRLDPVVRGGPGDGPLDGEQLDRFDRDGVLFLDRVLDQAEVDELRALAEEIPRRAEVRASDRTIVEPASDRVRSVFEVHRLDDRMRRLAADQRLAGVARQILGSDVYLHQSRVNFKPAIHGQGFFWHSDFETWHTEDGMPEMRAVSFSVALTENRPHNGPLMVIPGSHRRFVACVGETPDDHYKASLRNQEVGTPDDASLEELFARAGGRLLTQVGPPGSIAVFDCNAMHGSNSNITTLARSNVFFVYNSVENTLVEPFSAVAPRPEFIAARNFTPV